MGSWKGGGNQYIELIRDQYCKLLTNGKQLPAFPLEAVLGTEPRASEVGGESVTTLPPWPLVCEVKWVIFWPGLIESSVIYIYIYLHIYLATCYLAQQGLQGGRSCSEAVNSFFFQRGSLSWD